MQDQDAKNPFHAGEIAAQLHAGANNVAHQASRYIRDYLPDEHRAFHASLPFLVLAGADKLGQVWVTIIDGPKGFIQSPDAHSIVLATKISISDPLAESVQLGTHIGALGIDLATRRRNRFNGVIQPTDEGYLIAVKQTFGNCPRYIHPRQWVRKTQNQNALVQQSSALNESQIKLIQNADTLFIGSGQLTTDNTIARGFDASHRGGEKGFVKVVNDSTLQIPDYAGNQYFNTIGNLLIDDRVGLLFVDFETGEFLQITGRATVHWMTDGTRGQTDQRVISVDVDVVLSRREQIR